MPHACRISVLAHGKSSFPSPVKHFNIDGSGGAFGQGLQAVLSLLPEDQGRHHADPGNSAVPG